MSQAIFIIIKCGGLLCIYIHSALHSHYTCGLSTWKNYAFLFTKWFARMQHFVSNVSKLISAVRRFGYNKWPHELYDISF